MGRIVFRFWEIECDSADQKLIEQLRGIMPATVLATPTSIVATPTQAELPAARSIASHLLEGSLQELVMEAVQSQPGITLPDLASVVLNDTTPSARTRVGMAIAPLVTIGRLVRSKAGKLYTPAAAVSLPEFQSKGTVVMAPPPAPAATVAAKPCPEFPPCLGCRTGGACVGIVGVDKPARPAAPPKDSKPATTSPFSAALEQLQQQLVEVVGRQPGLRCAELAEQVLGEDTKANQIRIGRALSPLFAAERIVRREQRHYLPGAAPASKPMGRPPRETRTESLISQVVNEPPAFDVGQVGGVARPAVVAGSLTDRIVQAVLAKPGTTQHELAVALLGDASSANVRRIDMLLGTLVMSGRLARYNGRVYESVNQAAKLKLPPPHPAGAGRRPGSGQAPLAKVQTQKDLFDAIVAAFTEDHAAPIADVAREIFGESTGRSVDKLQLMLRQLCSSKRLKALGGNQYRPMVEDERFAEVGEDDDDEEDADGGDEPELVSNGHPDDEEPQELDVG